MKERGKSMEAQQDYNNFCSEYNYYYSSSSDLPCKKHPSASPVGICAFCLKDRLIKLVCSDCGEQRLSSCSCSDVSSYRNSSCTVDVGSVGRISFLIENEKSNSSGDEQKTLFSHMKQSKRRSGASEDVVLLKRSNSCVVEVKKSNGFWRIGKFFKKKRGKSGCSERNTSGLFDDNKSEIWMSDCVMDVSRSRSLCSFRGGGNLDQESEMGYSSAKISDFNDPEPRKSGFRNGLMDIETDVIRMDDHDHDHDPGFIDLKLDSSDKSKTEHPVFNKCDLPGFDKLKDEIFVGKIASGSASCRITVNERGIKKGSKGHSKVWKWIFKHHSGKKDLNHILES